MLLAAIWLRQSASNHCPTRAKNVEELAGHFASNAAYRLPVAAGWMQDALKMLYRFPAVRQPRRCSLVVIRSPLRAPHLEESRSSTAK
ncbi:hypothetical protein IscW_ISCW005372 [Ixodes scapularis]|uniref:Uncharacterized protein n=1 Tax=Ixodes scapularis TaxID=6945 RepID=B7PKT2_IXOSC|nr:hypothetical protein IscW_ISCW005372 [Ixodes scapularis]|eukprot:XP_002434380.1 hypothetical protein IscW_ISCW005372 [Ixodes scapularis]